MTSAARDTVKAREDLRQQICRPPFYPGKPEQYKVVLPSCRLIDPGVARKVSEVHAAAKRWTADIERALAAMRPVRRQPLPTRRLDGADQRVVAELFRALYRREHQRRVKHMACIAKLNSALQRGAPWYLSHYKDVEELLRFATKDAKSDATAPLREALLTTVRAHLLSRR